MKIRLFLVLSLALVFTIGCQKDSDYSMSEPLTEQRVDAELPNQKERNTSYYTNNADSQSDLEDNIVSGLTDTGCGGSSGVSSRDLATPLCCCNLGDIQQVYFWNTYFVGIAVGDPRDFEATNWYLKTEITDDQTGQIIRTAFTEITPRQNRCDFFWNYFYNVNVPPGSYHPSCPDYFLTAEFEIYRAYNFNTNALYLCNRKTETIRVTIDLNDWCF
ncbi:MAG: hypothetical protein AAGG75_07470 [Bacteroidota bacterium]